jgi:hypothetical protein
MNLKGGVIVIGSLLWDDSPIRTKWRQLCLQDLSEKVAAPLKIRYGRQSSSREDTFTMIFSNHLSTGLGQGYIIPFKDDIKNYRQLEGQAFALASAEGIWKETNGPALIAKWGAVGLCINPNVEERDFKSIKIIKDRWTSMYKQYTTFDCDRFSINGELPTISKEGYLQIEWTKEMDMFDVLIATPVIAKPNRIATIEEIADHVNDYFYNNIKFGLTTYQDREIIEMIERFS